MEIRYWNLIKLEIGLDLKICEVVYSNLGDCRVCPIARHRSSWAGWLGHSSSRAGQATENCEQKVTNNMNPPVGKWNLNQSILTFCKIARMLRKKNSELWLILLLTCFQGPKVWKVGVISIWFCIFLSANQANQYTRIVTLTSEGLS